MNKWTALLIGLGLLLAASLVTGFALAGDRTDAPDGGDEEPPGNPPPVPSDEGIDPGECNLVHSINACLGDAAPTDIPVSDYMGVLTQALFDLQQRLSLDHIGSLRMAELESVTWPSSCLGVALPPNIVCDQVIVPGFRIVLEADRGLHTYHTSSDRVVYAGGIAWSHLSEVQAASGVTPVPPPPVPPPSAMVESTDSSFSIGVIELAIALGLFVLTVGLVVGGVVVYRRTNEAVERRAAAVAVAAGFLVLATVVLAGVVSGSASVMWPLPFIQLGLLGTAFWLWMLVDCAINEPTAGNDKLIWVLIILLAQVLGAALYLLVRRPQRLAGARS